MFVCLGNICRSPAAEGTFTSIVRKHNLLDEYHIDSCGTGGGSSNWYKPNGYSYHEGDAPDSRMISVAEKRHIDLSALQSRPLKKEDLSYFEYIVPMDHNNYEAILGAARYWGAKDEDVKKKLFMMTSFCKSERFSDYKVVPDPYYGGKDGFELVLDLLADSCDGLFNFIQNNKIKT
uniref:Phosphotyrosine protein phosphatase I domain-containing protein n=1 Tax=Arcella intermedia TaxID=1963864 RepID=A0A6B2LL42_9EUKA